MSDDFEGGASLPPRPHDHVIFTDLDGVEGVLVDLNTRQYYQLNETASLIWRGLSKGTPIAGIAREMADAYDVTIEHARRSVETALHDFIAYQLVGPPRDATRSD